MTDEQIAKLTLPELISTTQSTKAPSGALFSCEPVEGVNIAPAQKKELKP